MKKNANYQINYTTNTVTFAPKFYEEATLDYNSEPALLVRQLQKEGFTVVRQTRKSPIKRYDPNKLKMLTYKQMRDFLNLLDDHDDMIAEFDSLIAAHKHDGDRMKTVNAWFRNECPQYGHSTMYEWAEDGKHIVHNPNPAVDDKPLLTKVG